jgi:hypothetical protein
MMVLRLSYLLFFLVSVTTHAFQPELIHSGQEDNIYPSWSLAEPAHLHPLGGTLPTARVQHSVSYVKPYIVVFGGFSNSGQFLDDVHIYDTRQQKWSGPILKYINHNHRGTVIEISGNEMLDIQDTDIEQSIRGIPMGQTGLEGDPPAKRAEHSESTANGLVYIFGGYGGEGGEYGLMNDLYTFNPRALQWLRIDATSGHVPPRRAGAGLVANAGTIEGSPVQIYLFGGRGSTMSSGNNLALNDVWRFDTGSEHWTKMNRESDNALSPIGREYAACGMLRNRLFIYGGLDPSSGLILSDVWAFHTGTKTWTQLQSSSPDRFPKVPGFAPPPLYGAAMVVTNDDNFLLYGGAGGGGMCGMGKCQREHTTLGQVYRFMVGVEKRLDDVQLVAKIDDVFDGDVLHNNDNQYLRQDLCSWNYSRLTADENSEGTADRGRLRKAYALEKVAYAPEIDVLYEFGGVEAVRGELRSASQIAGSLYNPLSLDSGGELGFKTSDIEAGEHLKTHLDILINGVWEFEDSFDQAQPIRKRDSAKDLMFNRAFKTHKVTDLDIILISREDLDFTN